jgi:hypothetical protein
MKMTKQTRNLLTDRELTAEQAKVVDALAEGQDLAQAAAAAGVPAQSIRAWSRRDPVFIAELNMARRAGWDGGADKLRALIPKAIDALGGLLEAEDPKVKHAAAVSILRAVGLYGQDLAPDGPTSPHAASNKLIFDDL